MNEKAEVQLEIIKILLEDHDTPPAINRILKANQARVLAVLKRTAESAGLEGNRENEINAILGLEPDKFDLSPKLNAFVKKLLSSFDRSDRTHCSIENRRKLVEKLLANPQKIASLQKIEEFGLTLYLTEVDGEDFLFDGIPENPTSNTSINNLTYQQALECVKTIGSGATLTSCVRFIKFGKVKEDKTQRIPHNNQTQIWEMGFLETEDAFVWLETTEKDNLQSDKAMYGYYEFRTLNTHNRNMNNLGTFCCSLTV